jgi:hypothetical protein
MEDKIGTMKLKIQSDFAFRQVLLALIPVAISVFLVYQIAMKSGYNVHPDEYAHLDAVCYYESHWWPPEVNSDGIVYSGYGWSRLYDGELVYLLYGKLIRFKDTIQYRLSSSVFEFPEIEDTEGHVLYLPAAFKEDDCGLIITTYPKYRPLNVWLYLFTLLILMAVGRKHPWPFLIAILLLSMPQVSYIYSYVNSDAWGLSMSVFLFSFVLVRRKRLLNSWPDLLVLSVLTTLVILSKKTFWLAIPYAYLLFGLGLIEDWKVRSANLIKVSLFRLLFLFLLTLLWITPLKVIYPLSQGNFAERALNMREERAVPGYKPSQPTQIGFHLAERGYPVWSVANMLWVKQSAASFYGLFGYMSERLPQWLYTLAYGLLIILAAITYTNLVINWRALPFIERYMILIAPVSIFLVILASLYNSWTFDFQPQGRYLFAALIPLALMEGGLFCYESRSVRGVRLTTWVVLYFIYLAVLWIFVLGNPELIPH